MPPKMVTTKKLFKKTGKKIIGSVDPNRSRYGQPLASKITSIDAGLSVGLPDRLRIKLRWDDQYAFQGAPNKNNLFRANSVFDPDASGIFSNAPAFYNFWKTAFSKYVVLGAKIKVLCNSLASEPCEVVLWASDVDISSSTFSQLRSSKRAKSIMVGPVTGMGKGKLSMSASTEEIMGQKEIEADPSLYTALNANPTDVWYYGVMAQTFDASNLNLFLRVIIEMDVVLKDLVGYTS